MPFASDELYRGYLRRNLAKFVTVVKPLEIMVHLPCLTQSDRKERKALEKVLLLKDEIVAKQNSTGNSYAMELLLDCLKRRENWPNHLIGALRSCEHSDLAADIEREYNALNGRRPPSSPVSPSADARPVPGPNGSRPEHADAPVPPSPVPPSPVSPAPVSPAPVSPAPAPSSSAAAEAVQLPPASGNSPHRAVQPEALSSSKSPTPSNAGAVPASVRTQDPAVPVERNHPAAYKPADPGTHTVPSVSSFVSPKPHTSARAVPAPDPQLSPINFPVQDTNPPQANASQVPEEDAETGYNPVWRNHQHAGFIRRPGPQRSEGPVIASAGRGQVGLPNTSHSGHGVVGEDEYFSKPQVLQSHPVQVHRISGEVEPLSEEPYSGNSERFMWSSSSVASCTFESTAPTSTGIWHQEPEEDSYESQPLSEDVRMLEGHVSKGSPVLNFAGQNPNPLQKEPISQPESCRPADVSRTLQEKRESHSSSSLLENYYVPVFALTGVAVLVFLWRLRK